MLYLGVEQRLLRAHVGKDMVCPTEISLTPSETAVPFWGQASQAVSTLPPERDCSPKKVKQAYLGLQLFFCRGLRKPIFSRPRTCSTVEGVRMVLQKIEPNFFNAQADECRRALPVLLVMSTYVRADRHTLQVLP